MCVWCYGPPEALCFRSVRLTVRAYIRLCVGAYVYWRVCKAQSLPWCCEINTCLLLSAVRAGDIDRQWRAAQHGVQQQMRGQCHVYN